MSSAADRSSAIVEIVPPENILRQMRGDRRQRHVGAVEQFGLDGGDPVGGEATHQLLGMHRAGLGRRQRHQWFVGAVFGGLAGGLDHVIAIFGADQAVLHRSGTVVADMDDAAGLRHQVRWPHAEGFVERLALFLQAFGFAFELIEGLLVAVFVGQPFHLRVQRRDATIQVLQGGCFLGIRLALRLAQFAVLDVLVEGIADSDIDPFPAFGRDLLGALL